MPEDLRDDERKAIDAAIATAIAREREACAKVADDWLLAYGERQVEHVSPRKWAGDAVRDIAEAIRARLEDGRLEPAPRRDLTPEDIVALVNDG